MDVFNYDNAVSAYNDIEAFQSEKQQQFKELVQQYKEGAEQVIFPAVDLFRRGAEAYSNAASKVSSAAENLPEGVQSALNTASENLQSSFSSAVRGVSDNLANRMQTNAFERDPESDIVSNGENMDIIDRAQSFFRAPGGGALGEGGVSGISRVAPEAQSIGENLANRATSAVSSAVSEGVEAASTAASTAETIGSSFAAAAGNVALEAIPVVGELGMIGLGIYDWIKGDTEKAPTIQAYAAPVLEKGIQ